MRLRVGVALSALVLGASVLGCGPVEVAIVISGAAAEDGCRTVEQVVQRGTLRSDGSCVDFVDLTPGTSSIFPGDHCFRARESTSCGRCRRGETQAPGLDGAARVEIVLSSWEDCDVEVHGVGRSCADRGLEPLTPAPNPAALRGGLTQTCAWGRDERSDGQPGGLNVYCWSAEAPSRMSLSSAVFEMDGDAVCEAASCPFPRCSDRTGGTHFASRGWLCTDCDGAVECTRPSIQRMFPGPITSFARGGEMDCALVDGSPVCVSARGVQTYALPSGVTDATDVFVFGNRMCAATRDVDDAVYSFHCWRDPSQMPSQLTNGSQQYLELQDACATDDAICFLRGNSVSCYQSNDDEASAVAVGGLTRGVFESLSCTDRLVCALNVDDEWGSEVWCWEPGADPDAPSGVAGARGSSPAQVCLAPQG